MHKDALVAWLSSEVSRLTGLETVEVDQPLSGFGVDSAAIAAMSGALGDMLGRPVEPTMIFEYPTIEALAGALAGSAPPTHKAATPVTVEAMEIAIVGIACRMPQAPDKDTYWRNLLRGVDGVTRPDAARLALGADPTRAAGGGELPAEAGLIADIDAFDAGFFRISAAEAEAMDPQQRMLLEVAWEALEDAGCAPEALRGQQVGVFVGISHADYASRLRGRPDGATPFAGTGNALSVAANRLSYVYDLRGPSLAVDTACSSSLTALHLAATSLSRGECQTALVGAASLLLDGELTAVLQAAGMLAADARCKPFDALANGYVRGEGCGVVVLRPLRDALASGDRIYAVVRGTAVGQDGRSNGLTAPNPAAQEAVLRAAYQRAGVAPAQVSYIEAHGTGTSLGDPIEITALGRVMGAGRASDQPLLVGSVKSNIGHLEAAAGMAGLIKTALAVHAGVIPGNLRYETPSPRIDLAGVNLRVVGATTEWPGPQEERFCGVSSFGFGGANAHAVLSAPPKTLLQGRAQENGSELVLISAHTEAALRETARRWGDWLSSPSGQHVPLGHVAHTAGRRQPLAVRAALIAESSTDLRRQLIELAAAPRAPQQARPNRRTILVFPGQGDHWAKGRWSRFASDRLFWSVIRRCSEILQSNGERWSLEDLVRRDDPDLFATAERAQPAIFALQTAMVAVLKAHGVTADAVLGHSIGEIAAAAAAGALSLEQGCEVSLLRGRAMAEHAQGGGALAVDMPEAEALTLLTGHPSLDVAAVNGPQATTLAGDMASLLELEAMLQEQGRRTHWVSRSFAFHSRLMTSAAAALRAGLSDLLPSPVGAAFHSSVHGRRMDAPELDAEYWAANLGQTVRFSDGVQSLSITADDIIIEVAPRQVLRSAIREASNLTGAPETLVAIGEADTADRAQLSVVGRLFTTGLRVRRRQGPGLREPVVDLPPRAWDRRRYWAAQAPVQDLPPREAELLIASSAAKLEVWQRQLGGSRETTLMEHQVAGRALLPAAAHISLVLTALGGAAAAIQLEGGRILAPVDLDDGLVTTRLVVMGEPQGRRRIELYKVGAGPKPLTLVSEFEVTTLAQDLPEFAEAPEEIRARLKDAWSESELYNALAERGLVYGPSFRLATDIRSGAGEALGRIKPPSDGEFHAEAIDPRILDSALHLLLPALASSGSALASGVPVGFRRLVLVQKPSGEIFAHAAVRVGDGGNPLGSVRLFDGSGRTIALLEDVAFSPLATRQRPAASPTELFTYQTDWVVSKSQQVLDAQGRTIALFAGDQPIAEMLRDHLSALGHRCTVIVASGLNSPGGSQGDDELLGALREVLRGSDGQLDAVVSLWDLEGSRPADPSQRAIRALNLIKAVSVVPTARPPLLVLATHRTQLGEALDPAAAVVWGLSKAAPFENPGLTCRCVDLADDDFPDQLTALTDELSYADTEIEVGWRGGSRLVRRIVSVQAPDPAPPTLKADATYVVSGANGALGQRSVRWLAARGARHIVGMGRSAAPSAALQAAAADLIADGTSFHYLSADLTDAELLHAAWKMRPGAPPVRGLIHAAGVLRDGPMLSMTAAEVEEVVCTKAEGLVNLRSAIGQGPLDFTLLFSSAAAILGSPGQANYCAANAFLDAYASSAKRRGEMVVSLGWGPWAGGGMASDAAHGAQTAVGGLTAIPPAAGLDFLDRAFSLESGHMVVVPFDLSNLIQYYPEGPGFQFFEELLAGGGTVLRSAGRSSSVASRPDISAVFVEPRTEAERLIAGVWQRALGIDRVGVDDGFFELGGDSVLGNQILVEIGRRIGVVIEPADAFEMFTVAGLAALAEQQLIAEIEGMSEVEVMAEVG